MRNHSTIVAHGVSLTIITSDRALGKRISRGADGAITKTALGEMTTGTAERVTIQTLRQFAKWRRKLGPKQALAYGVTAHVKVAITTDAELCGLAVSPQRAGMPLVARTKEHFRWPSGAGLMMLDYDPPEGADPMKPSDLVEALRHAVPELGDVALLWEPSASSCIYDADTDEEVRGVAGQRLYLPVTQADRIPEIGRVLFDRLVLAGYGRIELSAAGSKLRRTLVDAAVWSPERFDFICADTGDGLVRRPAESKIFPAANGDDNAWLDPDRVRPLTNAEQERLREIWRDLEAAAEPRAKEVREAAALRRACEELPNGTEEQISARAQQLAAAVANDRLPDDLLLHFHDGRRATVAEARTNAKDYHGATLADPLDPDGDPRCAQFYAHNKDGTGDPAINSFRHGGKVYVLYAPPDAGGLPGPEEQEAAEGRRAAEPIRNRLMYEDVPAEEAAATLQLLPPKGQEAGLAEIETVDPEVAQQTRELLARIGASSAVATAETSRFAITRIGEFAKLKPVSWHIKGVLPAEGVAFVYGPPGSGKTFWALDIAGTVARGADQWRGHRVKAAAVVYVAGEGSTGVRQRAAAYLRENGLEDLPIGIIDDVPNLFAEKTHAGLLAQRVNEAAAALGKVGIIILDTLAATTPGANENAAEDMGLVLSRVHALQKATGALVLIVHHSGKEDSRGLRGWSGLLGAADAVFKVEKDDSGLRQVVVEKLKDGSADGKYGFRLKSVHLGEDEDGDAINSCVVEQTEDTIEPKRGRTREQPLELPAEAQDERLVRMGKDQKLAFEQLKLLAEQKGQVQYERKEAIATLGELCKREGWQPRRITDKGTEVVEGLIKRGILKPLDSDWLLFQLDPVEAPSLAVSDDGGGKDEL